ncbi:hypothetical protein C8R48DRAFT_675562 [Suillus tomentosus]|nr:hypothetical protein C8R48DRAFT_675562 [Suillus tomentosus]
MSHTRKLSDANATRRPPIRPAPRRVPQGFFDNVQDRGSSSTTHPNPSLHRLRNPFALSWGSRPRALLAGLPSLFHRFPPNTDELDEPQQRPRGPGTSSHRSPPVVDVPALDDKKALYVSRRPERASDKAKRVDTSKWWLDLPEVIINKTKFAWTYDRSSHCKREKPLISMSTTSNSSVMMKSAENQQSLTAKVLGLSNQRVPKKRVVRDDEDQDAVGGPRKKQYKSKEILSDTDHEMS